MNKIEFRSKDRFSTSTDSIERKPTEKLDSVEFSTTIRNEIRNKDRKSMSVVSSSLNNITKSRRNSSVLEKFESNNQQIPEFMKIQLNRVDASRPKCNVVLAKNVKETVEDKGIIRRFSSENVEISDSNKSILPQNEIQPITSLKRYSSSTSNTPLITQQIRIDDNNSKNLDKKVVDEENNILRTSSHNTYQQITSAKHSSHFYEQRKNL